MIAKIKAWADLTRIHFAFAWPLLFCLGLALAYRNYGGFSWTLTATAALIGLLGFEAGLVLNDYVDRRIDRNDVERDRLTKYWRPFGSRPLPEGSITARHAGALFVFLVALTTLLIATLPSPHSLYLFGIMVYSYSVEYFYQVKKRRQKVPVAQLVGRTDFALFPVAGYLCHGSPDMTALLFFLFFYPFTLAHLGVNDLADVVNDSARGMKTVTLLYGEKGTAYWILLFSGAHLIIALIFAGMLGTMAAGGFLIGFALLFIANYRIFTDTTPDTALRVLPLFHLTMVIYAVTVILSSVI